MTKALLLGGGPNVGKTTLANGIPDFLNQGIRKEGLIGVLEKMGKKVKYFPEVARSNKNEQILGYQGFEAFQEAIFVDWIERLPMIIALKEQNIYDVLVIDRSLLGHLGFVIDSYFNNKYPNRYEFRVLGETLYQLLDRPKTMFAYLQQWYRDTYKADIPEHDYLYDVNIFGYKSMKLRSSNPEREHFDPQKLEIYMSKIDAYYVTKTIKFSNSMETDRDVLFEQVKKELSILK